MTDAPTAPVIAIIHQNRDVADVLCSLLDGEGYRCIPLPLLDPERGESDVLASPDRSNAAVVIYDIPPPYAANWALLQRLRARSSHQARAFLVLTTDNSLLESFRGPADAIDILSEPFNLDDLVAAVRRAADGWRDHGSPPAPGCEPSDCVHVGLAHPPDAAGDGD